MRQAPWQPCGFLHHTVIDRDRRQCAILFVNGGLGGSLLNEEANLFDSATEYRLMAANLIENRRSAPDEHAAVPIIIARLQILCRFGCIRLLNEAGNRMPLECSPLRQDCLFRRLDVTIAGFWPDRLDAKSNEDTI